MAELNEEQLLHFLGVEDRRQIKLMPIQLCTREKYRSRYQNHLLSIPYSVPVSDICDKMFGKYGFKFPHSMEIKIKVPNILSELIDCTWDHRDSKFTYNFRCYFPFKQTYYGGHYSVTYTVKNNISILYHSYPPIDNLKECIEYCNTYNEKFRVMEDLRDLHSYLSELKPVIQKFVANIDNLYKL